MTVQPQPIPLALDGGALGGAGTVDEIPIPFSVLIDSGSPVTVYHKQGETAPYGHMGFFRLFAAGPPSPPRLEIQNIQLFQSELRSVGLGAGFPVGGVLGGDNLKGFAVEFDYRGAQPTATFVESILPCSCELSQVGMDHACESVFPFQLLGGQETIAIGTNLFTYPPTRVVLDACLEPEPDPVSQNLECAGNERYQPHGVDVKLLVATGFPGLGLGAGAYDRLRGSGAAAMALASPVRLHLPDVDDDGPDSAGLAVGTGTLGGANVSALALVSHELYLGPCAELARSRRMRRSPQNTAIEAFCLETPADPRTPLPCGDIPNQPPACDDTNAAAHVAAVIELTQPLPIYVIDDTAPLLQSINNDVRPGAATVEGVLGTEVLDRLVSAIDYPHSRFLARCASDADCIGYARFIQASEQGDCEDPSACVSPMLISTTQGDPNLGGRCLAP